MYRNAFKMKLKAGHEAEYKKRHDEIWPELSALLIGSGILEYVIFLDEETNILFAFQKLKDDFDTTLIPAHPITIKWWAYMADIMETNTDNSPIVEPLMEVFCLN